MPCRDKHSFHGHVDDFLQDSLPVFVAAAFTPMIQAISGNAKLQTLAIIVSLTALKASLLEL